MDKNTVLCKTECVLTTKLPQGAVLLNTENKYFYTLNESACRIWEAINGKDSLASIAKRLAAHYRADSVSLLPALQRQIRHFLKEGLAKIKTARSCK